MEKAKNKKPGRRILSIALAVALMGLLQAIPGTVWTAYAADAITVTIDTEASVTLEDEDGDGYYEISDANGLYAFAVAVNSGNNRINGELTANIVVNETLEDSSRKWTPIGTSSKMYYGTFDGAGHTVKGIYVNTPEENYVGLFGYSAGTIKNVGVIDSSVCGKAYVGGVCGYSGGAVTDCYNAGSVNGDVNIGGVCGENWKTVTGCYNTGDVNGKEYIGGVCGENWKTVTGCYNTGDVNGTNYIGGVCGYNWSGKVTGCYNMGDVSGTNTIGGVCGSNSQGEVTNCYNMGIVSGTNTIGGVCGGYSGTVTGCYNTGTVSGTNSNSSGDVCGYNTGGTMTNCYYQNTAETDSFDGTTYKTEADFNSGAVCWLLNNSTASDESVWRQNIGTDALPVLDGPVVYSYEVSDTIFYSNIKTSPTYNDGVYEIDSADELLWFVYVVNNIDATIDAKLTADIAMNGIDWTMMSSFAGTFDGNGYTISGLNNHIDLWENKNVHGFICILADEGAVKNLTFTDAKVLPPDGAGATSAVIAYTNSGIVENCIVSNSTIHHNNRDALGVLVGNNEGTIRNSASISNTITRRYSSEKAVCGFVWKNSGSIENCFNYDCTYQNGSNRYAFTQSNTGTITNCYYYESSETLSDTTAEGVIEEKSADQFASGEVAYLLNGSTIKGDLAWGQTLGTDDYPVVKTEDNTVCASSDGSQYSNHNVFENGLCTCCGGYEKAAESENGVYQISNAGELLWFAEYVNNGEKNANAVLTNDIDMTNVKWTTICETELYFNAYGSDDGYVGTFDGQGHVIKNLTVTSSTSRDASVGLFGTVSGTIKNLGMVGFTLVDGGWDMRAGAIVGQLIKTGKVSDCYVMDSSIETGKHVAGGIAGCVYEGTVENCYTVNVTVTGHVDGNDTRYGCVTGDACADGSSADGTDRPGTVKNCYTDGSALTSTQKGANSVDGGEAGVSADRFASGEVAYLLNGTATDGTQSWYQTLSGNETDSYPVLNSTHGTVYQINKYDCPDDTEAEVSYSNTNEDIIAEEHSLEGCVCRICKNAVHKEFDEEGFCTVCGNGYEPAKQVSSEHHAELNATHNGYYAIETAGQLYWFAEYVNAGNTTANAVLTANLVVNASLEGTPREWTPIGNDSNRYNGTFDGDGKTVSGLYIYDIVEANDTGAAGLIGYAAENARIEKVGVIGSAFTITGKCVDIGGVCGVNKGSITNCYYTGTVSGNRGIVGGVCGANRGNITNCYNTGDVSGTNQVGGVCGVSNDKSITNCYNTGNVSGSERVGGVCGDTGVWETTTIINCYNTGSVSGTNQVGGVCGYVNCAIVTSCYNLGSVSGTEAVGGVCGYSYLGRIRNCYYDSEVYTGNAIGDDSSDSSSGVIEGKTTAQFASGEVAYLLNGTVTDSVWSAGATDGTQSWYQTLSGNETDAYPVLNSTHGTVYQINKYDCPEDTEAEVLYSNTKVDEDIRGTEHSYVNSVCTGCGKKIELTITLDEGDAFADGEYTFANNVHTISTDKKVTITGTTTTETVVIASDVNANITLNGVSIDVSSTENTCAFKIEDYSKGNVTITLADGSTNILKSGANCAGLQKNGTEGTLTIAGTGTLTATGGNSGAGIGGGGRAIVSGYITISGGVVTATGGSEGAGIGSGPNAAGLVFIISGGSVKATAGDEANAIGGGWGMSAKTPTLADKTTKVYLLEIANENKLDIVINGVDYPDAHGEETKIYAYLPAGTDAEPNEIKVGETVTRYYYDAESKSWVKTCGSGNHVDTDKNCVCDNCVYTFEHKDDNTDGKCDTCGEVMYGVSLAGHNLVLGDLIAVNFYFELDEKKDFTDAYVELSKDGGETKKVLVDEAEKNTEIAEGKTYYVFTYEVAAKEMEQEITATFYDAETNKLLETTYSVAKYAEDTLDEDSTATDSTKAMVKAMITYGEFAEQYFGEASTSTPDTFGLKDKDIIVSALSNQTLSKPEPTEEQASIQYAGCSLILLADTTLRVYFEPAEGVDLANVTFTSGGELTKGSYTEDGKTYYYADVTGIKPKALSASITVTASVNNTAYEVTLSPMFYVKEMLGRNTTETNLVNLLRALYAYYEVANEYKNQ